MTVSRATPAIAALAAILLLTGCVGTAETPPDAAGTSAGSGTPAGETGPDGSALPGLYVTPDIGMIALPSGGVRLVSTRPCDELSRLLAAGQWRVVDRLSFGAMGAAELAMLAGFGGVAGTLLQRDDRLAFAALDGGEQCTATVAAAPRGEIRLEGPGLPGASTGWTTATRCYESEATGDLSVSVYFDTDAQVGGQGQFALVREGDGYTVDAGDDGSAVNLSLLRHGDRFLGSMTAAHESGVEPSLMALVAGDSFSGVATMTTAAGAPPAGTVSLHGLVDADSWEGDISLTLPFACPTVIATA